MLSWYSTGYKAKFLAHVNFFTKEHNSIITIRGVANRWYLSRGNKNFVIFEVCTLMSRKAGVCI